MLEASKVTINNKTYDLNYLNRSKKTNLRRKIVIEYIQSKPAGEYIKMEEFQRICNFSKYANTWGFIKRMIRDGVITQNEGERKRSYYYSVIGTVRVRKQAENKIHSIPDIHGVSVVEVKNPDINTFIADMQKLGVEFSITISNKQVK